MGMHWGNMATNVRGLIMYSLSPYEQKAFAGAISRGVPNMVRRFRGQVFRVLPRKFNVCCFFNYGLFAALGDI